MSERMTAELVRDVLRMAFPVHSDCGSRYCSALYRDLPTRHELCCRMGDKENCFDNACTESFFIIPLRSRRFTTTTFHARGVPTNGLRVYSVTYNRVRRHTTFGNVSSETFEAMFAAKSCVHDY
jgi:putative transposase